jgi:hypothetical protein
VNHKAWDIIAVYIVLPIVWFLIGMFGSGFLLEFYKSKREFDIDEHRAEDHERAVDKVSMTVGAVSAMGWLAYHIFTN